MEEMQQAEELGDFIYAPPTEDNNEESEEFADATGATEVCSFWLLECVCVCVWLAVSG